MVFCTRTPGSFEAARQERLEVSGNPSQYDDLGRFVAEQESAHGDVARAADEIADRLERTGGLWSP